MKIYTIEVNYTSKRELIDVEAKEVKDAIIKVMKMVKAKERNIGSYYTLVSVVVKN